MNLETEVFPFSGFYLFDDSVDTEALLINQCKLSSVASSKLLLSSLKSESDVLSCVHLNCRSIEAHRADIGGLISSFNHDVDIYFLSETWLRNNAMISFDNYCSYHVFRANRAGGGVSLLIRNNLLSHEVVCCFKSSSFEYICRLLPSPEPTLLIGIYRPPNTNEVQFLSELDEFLHLLSVTHVGVKMVLAGDFNINLIEYSGNSARFMDLAISYSLFPNIFKPTRTASKTLLDNIFISWPRLLASRVLTVDISDHLPVLTIIKDSVRPKSKSSTKIELARSFSASFIAKFQTCLASDNWEKVYAERDPTIAYKTFISSVQNAFHQCFLLKVINNTKKNVPRVSWMTPGLCKCVHKRSAMYKSI